MKLSQTEAKDLMCLISNSFFVTLTWADGYRNTVCACAGTPRGGHLSEHSPCTNYSFSLSASCYFLSSLFLTVVSLCSLISRSLFRLRIVLEQDNTNKVIDLGQG